MRVLQFAKRPVVVLAAVCVALAGCGGDSGPTVPFNPAGASADMQAVGETFDSPTFASFSSLSVLFDPALGGAPLVSSSASAMDIRGSRDVRAAAVRTADRIGRMLPRTANGNFSASSAAIPPEVAGKTFVYSGGVYVVSSLTGAPANGVRFLLYAVDPVTGMPVEPLVQTGYVDIRDLSFGTTSRARIQVVSGNITYLDYTVTVTATSTSGVVTVAGLVTNNTTEATFNLRSTLTIDGGLSLDYSLDVPQRDLSIDLTLNASGTTPETSSISLTLEMRGQNGWVRMTGSFTSTGGTLTVYVNGDSFATITSTLGTEPTITGTDGQPLAQEDADALQRVFEFSNTTFIAFDQLVTPVGAFMN
jgi:hypothetical protein